MYEVCEKSSTKHIESSTTIDKAGEKEPCITTKRFEEEYEECYNTVDVISGLAPAVRLSLKFAVGHAMSAIES